MDGRLDALEFLKVSQKKFVQTWSQTSSLAEIWANGKTGI